MFVRKLVEKVSKKPVGNVDGLKSSDMNPRVVFHYGIPSGSAMFAYDTNQSIIAISTKDGRIKLFGKDNTQALLESDDTGPSKLLQFIQNQGILLNITLQNQIEVWDIEKRVLSHVHDFKEEITSFAVMQHGLYTYAGDSAGNITVLKVEQEPYRIVPMKYHIPISASRGNLSEASNDTAVIHVLPQPTAESKRILVIFIDGHITLWDIRESKSIFTTSGNMSQSPHQEAKKVTSACWVCPFGSKIAVGYSNGDILLWSIPSTPNLKTEVPSENVTQNTLICKLNLGFKSEKISITSLRWTETDRKTSRLYALGASDMASTNLFQVVLLNEHTESRTIKLGLQLPEPCVGIEIIVNSSEQSKHKQDVLLLLGKSGHIYAYDDNSIEKYLLQSQSRSPPSLPREVKVKMPLADYTITTAKFISNQQFMLSSSDEDYLLLGRSIPSLLHFEIKTKDGTLPFSGFTKIKNLYITGHRDGTINFWDVTCPFFIPLLSLKQQTEDNSSNGAAITALYYDGNSRVLLSGDQSGMVSIYKFKPEPYAMENSFMSFQGNTKKGNTHIIQSLKHIKVKGSVIALATSHSSRHVAVGSDQGYVSMVDIEGPTLLYEKHIASEICLGITSLQFGTCSLQGFEKNVLVVATRDSSVLALDRDNGNMLSTSMVCPKKPSRALFSQILDGQESLAKNSNMPDALDLNRGNPVEDVMPKQSYLLQCSEKAVYVYSLVHIVQGVKRVCQKKKFHSSSCCWASTFCSASDLGLILLFTSGKFEIRSLPELGLLKETSIRGFSYSPPKSNSFSDNTICSSWDGNLVMVNGDQELSVISVLPQKHFFRLSESVSQVYRKDLMISQECLAFGPLVTKEKKKGIFGSVLKDIKGSKAKQVPDAEIEDSKESIEELSTIFSTDNFPSDIENKNYTDEDEIELNIDDIDIDDPGEKPKEQSMLANLNKQKLANKLQSFKGFSGKFKQKKAKNEKNVSKEEQQDDKASAVDQIKKKYGFSLSGESSIAKMAESKLHENIKKLQGISLKTNEMQDTARSFSAMAKELLRTAEQDKRS